MRNRPTDVRVYSSASRRPRTRTPLARSRQQPRAARGPHRNASHRVHPAASGWSGKRRGRAAECLDVRSRVVARGRHLTLPLSLSNRLSFTHIAAPHLNPPHPPSRPRALLAARYPPTLPPPAPLAGLSTPAAARRQRRDRFGVLCSAFGLDEGAHCYSSSPTCPPPGGDTLLGPIRPLVPTRSRQPSPTRKTCATAASQRVAPHALAAASAINQRRGTSELLIPC